MELPCSRWHTFTYTQHEHTVCLYQHLKKKGKKTPLQGKLKEDIWCSVTKLLCQLALCWGFFGICSSSHPFCFNWLLLLVERNPVPTSWSRRWTRPLVWYLMGRSAWTENNCSLASRVVAALILGCFGARIADFQLSFSMWKWRI